MIRLPSVVLALVACAAALPAAAQGARGGGCLRYEPDTVDLAGVLERRTYYGAPGYGERPRTDARETGFYLRLPAPVCTEASPHDGGNDARRGVTRVQLVLDSAGYAALRPYLGRRVTLRGELFASFTGHHHAPLLLTALRPVRAGRPRGARQSRPGGLTSR